MIDVSIIIIVLCIIGILYPFAIYPMLLRFLMIVKRTSLHSLEQKKISLDEFPSVAVLIAAYNEAEYIEDAIHSIYAQDYPNVAVYIGSDGSSDATAEKVGALQQRYENLHFYDLTRRGKNRVNEYLVEHSSSDVIMHLDADCRLQKGAMLAMCSQYRDPEICAVLGTAIDNPLDGIEVDNHAEEQSSYRSLESKTRFMESSLASTVTSLGHCYSLRRAYRTPLPNDNVCDDYMPILNILLQKKRVIAERNAGAIEVRKPQPGMEFTQAQRFASCGMASVKQAWKLLLPTYGLVSLFLWSRKIMRWLLPVFLIIAMIAGMLGALQGNIVSMAFVLACACFVLLSLPGFFGISIFPIRQAYIFVRVNLSLIRAWMHFLGSNPSATWERPVA